MTYDVALEPDEVDRAARRLEAATTDLEAVAGRFPRGGDYGAAGVVVSLLLAAQAEATRLACDESAMLSAVTLAGTALLGTADEQAAVGVLALRPELDRAS